MRLRTSISFLVLAAACPLASVAQQSVTISTTTEAAIYTAGVTSVTTKEMEETKNQTSIAAMQGSIAAEFVKIRDWQDKYNSYLKTAGGFAELLKASSHIYSECVRIFMHLIDAGKAVSDNPEGVFGSMTMTDLYADAAAELIAVYALLKEAVTGEGSDHMLTGEERLTLAWELDDRLTSLDDRIHKLALAIRIFSLSDVWDDATAGIINKDNGKVAEAALGRWKKCVSITSVE